MIVIRGSPNYSYYFWRDVLRSLPGLTSQGLSDEAAGHIFTLCHNDYPSVVFVSKEVADEILCWMAKSPYWNLPPSPPHPDPHYYHAPNPKPHPVYWKVL